jgi:hypothetical protein
MGKERFHVHADILGSASKFFQRIASTDSTEITLGTKVLARYFRVYLDWKYNRKLTDALGDNGVVFPVSAMFEVWRLGDYLEDVSCKNAVMDLLEKEQLPKEKLMKSDPLFELLQDTSIDSGTGRWLVDHLARYASAGKFQRLRGVLQADMLFAVLNRVVELSGPTVLRAALFVADSQRYHEAEDKEGSIAVE